MVSRVLYSQRHRRQLTIRSEFVAGDVDERDRIGLSDNAHHRHEDSTDSVYLSLVKVWPELYKALPVASTLLEEVRRLTCLCGRALTAIELEK